MPATHADFTVLVTSKKGDVIDETVRQWEADSGVIRANVADIMHQNKDVAEVQVKTGDTVVHHFVRGETGKPEEKKEGE